MNAGRKVQDVQTPVEESNVAADSGKIRGPLVAERRRAFSWPAELRAEAIHVLLRLLCLVTSIISISTMVSAEQASTVVLFGISLPVNAKWNFADPLRVLVGICAVAAGHSLLQLLHSTTRFAKRSPIIPSRTYAWLIFACDQVFAYAILGACSASSGVSNLNRTGIRHTPFPNFCKPLNLFCTRIIISITFAFATFSLLAASVVMDVIWLSKF